MKQLKIFFLLTLIAAFSIPVMAADDSKKQCYTVNPADYQYDMSSYVIVMNGGLPIADFSQLQIGAFIDGKCHGVGSVKPLGGSYYVYLRIYDNAPSGANVSFEVYDGNTGREYTAGETITFVADGITGSPGAPLVLNIYSPVLGDVNNDGCVSISDLCELISYLANPSEIVINNESADINEDDKVDLEDVARLVDILVGE